MHLWLLGLPLLVLLSACETPLTRTQQLAIYRTRCLEYGYEPGTIEFARCMENQEHHDLTLSLKEKELKAREAENLLRQREVLIKEREEQRVKNPLKFKW